MTIISKGINTRLAYVVESSFGVIPNTPTMTTLDFTSSKLNYTKQTHSDDSIVGDRMRRNTGHGNTVASGDIATNFRYGEVDSLLEGLLYSSFSANVLKPGSTRKSFSIEEASLDVGQFRVFSGSLISKLALTIPLTGFVDATWSIMAQNHQITSSPLEMSVPGPSTNSPYFHGTAIINEGGSPSSIVSNITLSIDNGLTAQYALGKTAPIDFAESWITVSGQVTAFFADASLYNKFVNQTDSSLDVILEDAAGNEVEINLPNIQYSAATKDISGQGPQSLVMPFAARYHAAETSHIVITRTAA